MSGLRLTEEQYILLRNRIPQRVKKEVSIKSDYNLESIIIEAIQKYTFTVPNSIF